MSDWTLTKTRLFEGVWEGVLAGPEPGAAPPEIEVTHQQEPLAGVEVIARPDSADWVLRVPVPAEMRAMHVCPKYAAAWWLAQHTCMNATSRPDRARAARRAAVPRRTVPPQQCPYSIVPLAGRA